MDPRCSEVLTAWRKHGGTLIFYHVTGMTAHVPALEAKAISVAYLYISHKNDASKYHILRFVRTVSDHINMTRLKKEGTSVVYNSTKIKP